MRTSAAIVIMLLASALHAAPRPQKPGRPAFHAVLGGIFDPEGKIGYLGTWPGRIQAIDLATGKVKWTWQEKEHGTSRLRGGGNWLSLPKPVALVGGKLVVLVMAAKTEAEAMKSSSIRVLLLDGKGKKTGKSDVITFPARVTGSALQVASVVWAVGSDVYIRWKDTSEEGASLKDASGVVKVDTKSGKVAMLKMKNAPLPAMTKVPDVVAKAARRPVETPFGTELRTAVSGTFAIVAEVVGKGKKQNVTLKRWDLRTHKALPAVNLTQGHDLHVCLSADAATVFVLHAYASSCASGRITWQAFSTRTGNQRCKSSHDAGHRVKDTGQFRVTAIGQRAYVLYEGPISLGSSIGIYRPWLQAIDMKTGKPLWKRFIQDWSGDNKR